MRDVLLIASIGTVMILMGLTALIWPRRVAELDVTFPSGPDGTFVRIWIRILGVVFATLGALLSWGGHTLVPALLVGPWSLAAILWPAGVRSFQNRFFQPEDLGAADQTLLRVIGMSWIAAGVLIVQAGAIPAGVTFASLGAFAAALPRNFHAMHLAMRKRQVSPPRIWDLRFFGIAWTAFGLLFVYAAVDGKVSP